MDTLKTYVDILSRQINQMISVIGNMNVQANDLLTLFNFENKTDEDIKLIVKSYMDSMNISLSDVPSQQIVIQGVLDKISSLVG